MLLTVATVTAVVLGLVFVWYAVDVLLLIFAGVLLAVLLRGVSDWLSTHTPLSPGWALTIITLGLLAAIGAGVWLLAPGLAEQVTQLQQSLPAAVERVQERVAQYGWGQQLIEQAPSPSTLIDTPGDALAQATGVFSTTLGALFNLFIIVFVGLYLAADPRLYTHGLVRLVPHRRRGRARAVLSAIGNTLWWWLIGRLLAMVIVGVCTGVGLWLLGVPLAFTLGLLAALFDFIPNIGPILAAVPAVLLALLDSPTQALYVLVLYLVVQQVESYLLTPIIQQRTVKLPPVVTIFAQVSLGVLLGGLGLILASPLAAVVLVLVRMLYVEDVLDDRDNDTEDEEKVPQHHAQATAHE